MIYATLTQENRTENSFSLEGNTAIGRKLLPDKDLFELWERRITSSKHKNNGATRMAPISVTELQHQYSQKNLDLIISDNIDVSRRHLLFCVPNWGMNAYHVIDLFSYYGTTVNGENLTPAVPKKVSHGDRITILGKTEIPFIFKEVERVTKYEAIIIANPDGTLDCNEPIAAELEDLLLKRNFKVDTLKSNVQLKQVTNSIAQKARSLRSHDYLLFLYLGHGSKNGELRFADNGFVHASNLYSSLSTVPAKKIILLDCCYGKNFLIPEIPLNSAVAVSTSRLDLSYTNTFTKGLIRRLQDPRGGYFERVIDDACHYAEVELRLCGMEPGTKASMVTYFNTARDEDREQARKDMNNFIHQK